MKKFFVVFFIVLGVLSFQQAIFAQSSETVISNNSDIREAILWSHSDLTLSLADSCGLLDKEVQKSNGGYSALSYEDGLALKALGPEEYFKHFGNKSIVLCGSSFEDPDWKKNQPHAKSFYLLAYSRYGLEIAQARGSWILNSKEFTAMKKKD